MKAVIVLGLATAASAGITGCSIPTTYATATGQVCNGQTAPYVVSGFCVSGADRVVNSLTAANQIVTPMTGNTGAFSPGGAAALTATACAVPDTVSVWGPTTTVVTTPITTTAGACGALAADADFAVAATVFKGVTIQCAATYWPTRGYPGSMICLDGAGVDDVSIGSATGDDYFATGLFMPYDYTAANVGQAAMVTEFTGNNALICSQGCDLPTTICKDGNLHANIVGAGNGFASCKVAPQHQDGRMDTTFRFRCRNTPSIEYTATCVTPNFGTTAATGYAAQCGATDGATSVLLWNYHNVLDRYLAGINMAAGVIADDEFATVTAALKQGVVANLGAYATKGMPRSWNDNAFQPLKDGTSFVIDINGCAGAANLEARRRCVQHVLNWWRCEEDFPFFGGTTCYADNTVIACPTYELGFRCASSSKKGLWGLLGLLGLIPLFLLCCCLLFVCCIRRRKTEADVHFATFDPHAAPVVATQPVATTCNGFTGTPFTHPSQVPVL